MKRTGFIFFSVVAMLFCFINAYAATNETKLFVNGVDILSENEFPEGVIYDAQTNELILINSEITESFNVNGEFSAGIYYTSAENKTLRISLMGQNTIHTPQTAVGYGIYSDSPVEIGFPYDETTGTAIGNLNIKFSNVNQILDAKQNNVQVYGIYSEQLHLQDAVNVTAADAVCSYIENGTTSSTTNIAEAIIKLDNELIIDEKASLSVTNAGSTAVEANIITNFGNFTAHVTGNTHYDRNSIVNSTDMYIGGGLAEIYYGSSPSSRITVNVSETLTLNGGTLSVNMKEITEDYTATGISANTIVFSGGTLQVKGNRYGDAVNCAEISMTDGYIKTQKSEYSNSYLNADILNISGGKIDATGINALNLNISGTGQINSTGEVNVFENFTLENNGVLDIETDNWCALSLTDGGTVNIKGGKLNVTTNGDTGQTAGIYLHRGSTINITGGESHVEGDYGILYIHSTDYNVDKAISITGGYTDIESSKGAVFFRNDDYEPYDISTLTNINIKTNPENAKIINGEWTVESPYGAYDFYCAGYVSSDTTQILGTDEQPTNLLKNITFGTKNTALEIKTKTSLTPVATGTQFNIAVNDVQEKCTVFLALYKGDELCDIKTALYENENITFTSSQDYDYAKVMLWTDAKLMEAIALCEIVQ